MALNIIGEGLDNVNNQNMEVEMLLLQEDANGGMSNELCLFQPEKVVILLPSNLGPEKCAAWGVADLIHQEVTLREGQANDALHNIRVHLADKAVLFRKTVRTAKSQAMSTRAWAQVHSVDRAVSINATIYSKCRSQLANLGANDILTRYRPLEKEHLKVSTAVADPNARGQRNSTLAWFWSMDVEGDSESSDWLSKCELIGSPVTRH